MKKLIALGLIVAILAGGAWVMLSDSDSIDVTLSKVPDGGLTEAAYLVRSETDGMTVLTYPLTSTHGLTPNNVLVSEGPALGGEGVFVKTTTGGIPFAKGDNTMAVLSDEAFHNGTIEVDLNSSVSPNASRLTRMFARGFAGICFRVSEDVTAFECLYLRPENGQSEGETRRNHAVQYISGPDWDFARFREEAPEQYENPADIAPGQWHHLRIVVQDQTAKLFIDDGTEPVLSVDDLKLGADQTGGVALWVGPGTNGFFRNLVVTLDDSAN